MPVTFIYVGVGLAERRLFAEGLAGDSAVPAQTARRWTRLQVPPFEVVSGALLGDGTPLFAHLDSPIRLEQMQAVTTRYAHHLRYRVVK